MEKQTLAENIIRLAKDNSAFWKLNGDLNVTAIARASGVNQPTLKRILDGESKDQKQENIMGLAKALKTTASALRGESAQGTPFQSGLAPLEVWDENTPLGYDEVELPYFKEVELSAGSGSFEVQEDQGHKLRFIKKMLTDLSVNIKNAACVNITGNSMEPALENGSTVGVDTSRTAIVDGKLFALEHNGMLRVKYLYRPPDGVRPVP